MASTVVKSCGPQLFSDGNPTQKWSVDQLGRYAQEQDSVIVDGERCLTVSYWRLGLALNFARSNFAHRQWGKYLEELQIDKTRASRARSIQRSFKNQHDVTRLTVEEAYSRRKRKQGGRRRHYPRRRDHNMDGLEEFLGEVCEKAEWFLAEAEGTNIEAALKLSSLTDEAIRQLSELRDALQQQSRRKSMRSKRSGSR